MNRPFTSALFYLRTGNTGLAGLDLMAASSRWASFLEKFETDPPAPIDKDAGWETSIASISTALEAGRAHVDAADGEAAGRVLVGIKEALYELRRRNGLRVLADCVFDLNGKMDALYHYRRNPPDLEQDDIRSELEKMGRAYEELIAECRQLAAKPLRKDQDFQSLFGGALRSVRSLGGPLGSRDQRGVINVLRELRSFDRLIWLRWG
ncbi:MAG: hypothetical protein AAF441_07570 [Pseudomonadota bacterium]